MSAEKRYAGEKAVDYLKDGMVVGLGTGSTVAYTLKRIAAEKLDILGIPTSTATERLCKKLKIKTTTINEHLPEVSIDGADEVDCDNYLIKGGGGALTWEKVVDYRAKKFIVVATPDKLVDYLGQGFHLPVEVLPFAWGRIATEMESFFTRVDLRKKGKKPYVTDSKNYILDCYGKIEFPVGMEKRLNNIPGVVENGIFTKEIYRLIIGKPDGVDII